MKQDPEEPGLRERAGRDTMEGRNRKKEEGGNGVGGGEAAWTRGKA